MRGDTLRCEREGEIGHLVLDRPAVLNAVNQRMTLELDAALREIGADAGVRVLVVKGEGRGFCSGLDLREAAARAIDRQGQDEQPTSPWFRALDLLEKLDKLTIASIHGPCLGSGLELALGCDFRIAEEAAVFSMPQVLYGGVAEGGPAYRLPQLVGLAKAKEILLLGERFDAREAMRLGLLYRVVPRAELEGETQRLAHRCLALGSSAALAVKRLLREFALPDSERLGREIGRVVQDSARAGDFAESMRSYAARHRPRV